MKQTPEQIALRIEWHRRFLNNFLSPGTIKLTESETPKKATKSSKKKK